MRRSARPSSIDRTHVSLDVCAAAASEMAGLRRLVEAMRQEARALEAELYAAREERTAAEMERATVADEADAANTALVAGTRQAELMAQLEEVIT